jgi:hypothetical protein
VLQLAFDLMQRVQVEQFPQLRVAEQLAELGLIDRQRLCPAFRQRCVA